MSLFPDAPNVQLLLGKSISAESIYEGGDVYFDCRVNSSPPPDRVNWYHNVRKIFINIYIDNILLAKNISHLAYYATIS